MFTITFTMLKTTQFSSGQHHTANMSAGQKASCFGILPEGNYFKITLSISFEAAVSQICSKATWSDIWCMQRPRPVTQSTRWRDRYVEMEGFDASLYKRHITAYWRVMDRGEKDKDKRERGSEWTGLSLISFVLTYIMHKDASAYQYLTLGPIWKPTAHWRAHRLQ